MNEQRTTARSIFENFDILTLKNSVRLLCSLDNEDIEEFVKSYSSILIFLLNILDRERSLTLLSRLTDASVTYITEEELRLHLIREIAHVNAAEDFELLSLFLDSIDDSRSTPEPERIQELLKLLSRGHREQKIQFSYLEALEEKRARSILEQQIKQSPLNPLAILIFSDTTLQGLIIDVIVRSRPELLGFVPLPILEEGVKKNYRTFMSSTLFPHLPAALQNDLRELEDFLAAERQAVLALHEQKEGRVVSAALVLGRKLRPGLQDYFLEKLRQEMLLSDKDIQLLKSYQQLKEDL